MCQYLPKGQVELIESLISSAKYEIQLLNNNRGEPTIISSVGINNIAFPLSSSPSTSFLSTAMSTPLPGLPGTTTAGLLLPVAHRENSGGTISHSHPHPTSSFPASHSGGSSGSFILQQTNTLNQITTENYSILYKIKESMHTQSYSIELISEELYEFPTELLAVTGTLKCLNLSKNSIYLIPVSISQFKSLQKLYLNSNKLSHLPNGISELKCLEILDLSCNQFLEIPNQLCFLANLKNLYFSSNFIKFFPPDFAELRYSLESIHLSNNSISELPCTLSEFRCLYSLHCSHNSISSLPFPFPSSLEELNLQNNALSEIPDHFTSLVNLEMLILSNNSISSLPVHFSSLRNLQYLDISNNQLTSILEYISNIKLKQLRASANQFADLPDFITDDASILSFAKKR